MSNPQSPPVANRGPIPLASIPTPITYAALSPAQPPIQWVQVTSAGSGGLVVKDEGGTTRTYAGLVAGQTLYGPFSELTSMTCSGILAGDGKAPVFAAAIVAPGAVGALGSVKLSVAPADGANPIAVGSNDGRLDYVVGAPLTDTATTTVQRAAIKTSFLLAGTMSQGETITLGTVGAVVGDYIKIIRTSTSAQTAAIVNGGGGAGTLHTQPNSKINFTEARFDGTNWLLSACGMV